MKKINLRECSLHSLVNELTSRGFDVTFKAAKKEIVKGRKKAFCESYNPYIKLDIKKTAESYGVSIQMVYRWIKSYNNSK